MTEPASPTPAPAAAPAPAPAPAPAATPLALEQSEAQLRFARYLDRSTRIGLWVLMVTFVVYLLGLMDPHVPVQHLPEFWSLPVERYLALTDSPKGWGWLKLLLHGDVASMLGIVVLTGGTLVCLLGLVPLFWRQGDKAFVALCVAEVAVVLTAASGLFSGGG